MVGTGSFPRAARSRSPEAKGEFALLIRDAGAIERPALALTVDGV